jgi:hypothetical protein
VLYALKSFFLDGCNHFTVDENSSGRIGVIGINAKDYRGGNLSDC